MNKVFGMHLRTSAIVSGVFNIFILAICLIHSLRTFMDDDKEEAITKFTYITMFLMGIGEICAICLILGAVTNNHKLLFPWLVVDIMIIVLYGVISTSIFWFFFMFAGGWGSGFMKIYAPIIAVVAAIWAFQIYFYLGVKHLYKQLKFENGQQGILPTSTTQECHQHKHVKGIPDICL